MHQSPDPCCILYVFDFKSAELSPSARISARQLAAIPKPILAKRLNLQQRIAMTEEFGEASSPLIGVFQYMADLQSFAEQLGVAPCRRLKHDQRTDRRESLRKIHCSSGNPVEKENVCGLEIWQ